MEINKRRPYITLLHYEMICLIRLLVYLEMTVGGIHCSPFKVTFMRIKCLIYCVCGIFNEFRVMIQKLFVSCILFIILKMYQDNHIFYVAYYLAYVTSSPNFVTCVSVSNSLSKKGFESAYEFYFKMAWLLLFTSFSFPFFLIPLYSAPF